MSSLRNSPPRGRSNPQTASQTILATSEHQGSSSSGKTPGVAEAAKAAGAGLVRVPARRQALLGWQVDEPPAEATAAAHQAMAARRKGPAHRRGDGLGGTHCERCWNSAT